MPPVRKRRTRAEVLVRSAGIILMAGVLLALAGGATLAAWNMYGKLQTATGAADAAASELALLRAENAQIREDVTAMNSERGIEAALRERYGVVKPGEGVIQIVKPTENASSSDSSRKGNFVTRFFHAVFSAW